MCRPAESASRCNLGTLAGVYRTPAIHAEVTAVFTNTNPVRPYRGNGRPEAAYVIERMVDLAAAETRHRSGRIAPPQHHPARGDAVQDRPDLHLRLRRVRQEHGSGARAGRFAGFEARRAEARRRGRLRGIGLSNTIERAAAGGSRPPRSASTARGTLTLLLGRRSPRARARDHLQAAVCDRLGIASGRGHLHPGRHRQGGLRRGHAAARARRPWAARR